MDLARAEEALQSGDLVRAEMLLREKLRREPQDVAAILLLARIGMRCGRIDEASSLLDLCLELAPGFHEARFARAELLFRELRYGEAAAEIDQLLAADPQPPSWRLLKGAILAQSGRTGESLALYDAVLRQQPGEARIHVNRGRALQTAGRQAEAVAAFHAALAIDPGLGEAWWGLADLKTYRFEDEEIVRMREQLVVDTAYNDNRIFLDFALGKALEDRGAFAESFRHYAHGNAARRKTVSWDADRHHADVEAVAGLFDAAFFASRQGWGHLTGAPIFVVGLPRAGSTLLEQILASHSRVEGTLELPDVMGIVRRLAGRSHGDPRTRLAECMATLVEGDASLLGEEYMQRTAIHRSSAEYFIDKMPNNFIHVGLIHLMLPNAKIIDARRQPMACGFSVFRQLFANGQAFSYDLGEIGRYYRDYARLMTHWDAVLPGRVLRVDYESVVTDTENEVRRILEHCGLAFEPGCLEFHRNPRQVRTASSEQVRQPIYGAAMEQWRNFATQLEPLRRALEETVD